MYGLGVDQALEMGVVTADGRHTVISAESKGRLRELFWALRGGGGSTYGVVTSVVVKAHPAINLTTADFSFAVQNSSIPAPSSSVRTTEIETFWRGFNAVYAFGIPTFDAGGYLWTQVISTGNGSFIMQVKVRMPGRQYSKQRNSSSSCSQSSKPWESPYQRPRSRQECTAPLASNPPSNMRFASRLFPRSSFTNSTLFSSTMSAVRKAVEAGFFFHGSSFASTLGAGGYSYPPAVNPIWRETIMHAGVMGTTILGTLTAEKVDAAQERLQGYIDGIREVTPGGGSYLNEADLEEPDWQHAFWGSNYEKLVAVKKEWDPWGVFWAPVTVGNEGWAIESRDGSKSQNGRLCRIFRNGGKRLRKR